MDAIVMALICGWALLVRRSQMLPTYEVIEMEVIEIEVFACITLS